MYLIGWITKFEISAAKYVGSIIVKECLGLSWIFCLQLADRELNSQGACSQCHADGVGWLGWGDSLVPGPNRNSPVSYSRLKWSDFYTREQTKLLENLTFTTAHSYTTFSYTTVIQQIRPGVLKKKKRPLRPTKWLWTLLIRVRRLS